jgi:hypothetical protein
LGITSEVVRIASYTVNDYYNHIVAMSLRKLDNEVDTNDVPLVCWSLCRVELSIGLIVLQLSLIA